jgi:RNA polymerase sigma factor (sigma-70 family)
VTLETDDIARLYAEHAYSVLAFFARRTYQPEIAVDLMAETFALAFEDRADFRGSGDRQAIGWIYGIARNRLAEFLRRGEVERRALGRLGVEVPTLADWEHDRIERLAGLAALRDELDQQIAGLRDEQRQALRLRVIEERSYPEVARVLGVSEPTARARVSRALRALRKSTALHELRESSEHV